AAEVLPHHVGTDHEARDDLDRLRTAQVEGEAALVAVHGQEGRGHLPLRPCLVGGGRPRLVAFVRFDLYDVSAAEGQLIRPVRSGEVTGEIEDADAGERLGHFPSRLARAPDLTTSNSFRRSTIFSGVSLVRSL